MGLYRFSKTCYFKIFCRIRSPFLVLDRTFPMLDHSCAILLLVHTFSMLEHTFPMLDHSVYLLFSYFYLVNNIVT